MFTITNYLTIDIKLFDFSLNSRWIMRLTKISYYKFGEATHKKEQVGMFL